MLSGPSNLYRRVRRRFGPRKFRAYGAGPGKTGTHSLANIFESHYRSAHEAQARQTIAMLLRYRSGRASESDLRAFIRRRDKELRLEMDSAGYNPLMAAVIADEYPDAKFIITVRDCFTWANSAINQFLNNPNAQQHWLEWRESIFGSLENCRYDEPEDVLRSHNVWNLDSIYNVWASHYSAVLDSVAEDRILIVRISEIRNRLDDIAEFLGVSGKTLDPSRSMAYKAPKDFGLLAKVDPDVVNHRAQEICGSLMQQFYPDRRCEVAEFLPKVS